MAQIPLIQILILLIILNIAITKQLPYLLSRLLIDPPVGIAIIAGLVVGITVHEFSHAFVAYRLGDPTAKLAGRLTLNPAAHLDPLGTMTLLFIGFGWGKPTPFDPFNLRNVKRDSALISVAGAASNFAIATLLALPYLLAYYSQNLNVTLNTIYNFLTPVIFFNILLGVFNLIPLHPLDGFKVLAGILPRHWYDDFIQTEGYGIFILIILIVTGALGRVLIPATSNLFEFLIPGFAAPF